MAKVVIQGVDAAGREKTVLVAADGSLSSATTVSGPVDTELPPARLAADNLPLPTAPDVLATLMVYDGTNLRLARANASGQLVSVPASGALTDRSGTITLGGTSQQLMAANAARRYLFVQNVSAGDLWVNFGVAAAQAQPSVKIATNGTFIMDGSFVSTEAVNIVGATTAQAFTAKEA